MERIKKKVSIAIIAVLCVVAFFFLLLSLPNIESRTWVLSSAQQADAPYFVVAHNKNVNVSKEDGSLFQFSKPIELICEAKNGKLVLTDKTNGKTYEGTYTPNSSLFGRFKGGSYTVVIEGVEGKANISSKFNRTLLISVGGYYLSFEAKFD